MHAFSEASSTFGRFAFDQKATESCVTWLIVLFDDDAFARVVEAVSIMLDIMSSSPRLMRCI